MILVTGTLRFGAGEIERLKPVLVKNVKATRQEQGCHHYSYGVDLEDPNVLHIREFWEDEESMAAHMASAHVAALMEALGNAKFEAESAKVWDATYLRELMG